MRLWTRCVPAAVLALVLLAAPAAARAGERCADAGALPGQVSRQRLSAATLCLINHERGSRGLARLRADRDLDSAATGFARQMVRQRFFDHTSPGGSTMTSRIRATDYLRGAVSWSAGENIAWGTGVLATPRATVQAWMRSAGHRRNLLDPGFRDVGIGVADGAPEALGEGEQGATWVTDFGRRVRR
jgi:uncharacterized protein YkwD